MLYIYYNMCMFLKYTQGEVYHEDKRSENRKV